MQWGLTDQAAVLVLGVSALIALAAVYSRARKGRQFVYGVGWYAICLAAPVLLLSHNYLIDAPRILYLGSIGAAWLWANAIAHLASPIGSRVRFRQGLAVALALSILVPSFVFIRQRMDLHHLNATPLNQALAVARQSDRNANLLFVNLPAWVSTPQFWYPIGHEGALFMPKYSGMADFVSTNLNQSSRAAAVEFNSLSTPEPYYYGVYGPALGWDELEPRVREADRVYFTMYAPDKIDLIEAGRLTRTSAGALPGAIIFSDAAALQQTDWSICARRLQVRLNWLAAPAGGDWRVFVHVLNPDGTLAAQHDSPPMLGLMPFWKFQKGDQVEDVHPIDLTGLARDRQYTIAVGLYDPATGQRLAPTSTNQAAPEDRAVRIGQFTIGDAQDACR
jgi:hypothetical protein